jgi:hypothetical protein
VRDFEVVPDDSDTVRFPRFLKTQTQDIEYLAGSGAGETKYLLHHANKEKKLFTDITKGDKADKF